MSSNQLIGQVLLWAGFISAALAACSQKEFDILPEQERVALAKLEAGASVSETELKKFTDKSLAELSADELSEVVDGVAPLIKERADAAKKAAEEAANSEATEEEAEKPSEDEAQEEPEKSYGKSEFDNARIGLLESKWATVNWIWYIGSMVIGVIGVFLLRSSAKAAAGETEKVAAEYSTITDSLSKLLTQVGTLRKELDKMSPQEIVNFIDSTCSEPYADFADSRNALIQRFGLQPFADIMTQFASGERFTNRAWSAAADGYINEVKDCIERAHAHLTRANELIAEQEKAISG